MPDDNDARAFLFDLLRTPSPTGYEIDGQRVWANRVRPFADRVENDTYGNTWATLEGTDPAAPTFMLESHADEIAFMVKTISKEGLLSLGRVGGSDSTSARGRRLTILGDKGHVRGIIGVTAVHIRGEEKELPKMHDLFVDLGAESDEQVAGMGIRVGHFAVFADGPEPMGEHYVIGRALDNRISSYIIAQVLFKLHQSAARPAATVLAVNAVQEEIGGYGATMITHRLMPQVAICLDVTHATDSPGISQSEHGKVTLGGAPSINHGASVHPLVAQRLMAVAEGMDLKLQHEATSRGTGTDTDSIYFVREGVPSALVSIPLRYMHSTVEMVDMRVVDKTVDFLVAFIHSLKAGDAFRWEL